MLSPHRRMNTPTNSNFKEHLPPPTTSGIHYGMPSRHFWTWIMDHTKQYQSHDLPYHMIGHKELMQPWNFSFHFWWIFSDQAVNLRGVSPGLIPYSLSPSSPPLFISHAALYNSSASNSNQTSIIHTGRDLQLQSHDSWRSFKSESHCGSLHRNLGASNSDYRRQQNVGSHTDRDVLHTGTRTKWGCYFRQSQDFQWQQTR